MAHHEAPSWRRSRPEEVSTPDGPSEFVRLWRGFMTARAALGLVLLLLQGVLQVLGPAQDPLLLLVCALYWLETLAVRLLGRPRRLGRTFDPQWLWTIGVDMLAFALLQLEQGQAPVNYTALLAFPVLLASVLGTLPLALGTAATATLLMLAQAGALTLRQPDAATVSLLAQSALSCVGYFVIAIVASQIAARLASAEQRSRRSHLAVHVQRQVNELVIEALNDGILVVGTDGMVWAANPAALRLLGRDAGTPFGLSIEPGWDELAAMAARCVAANRGERATVVLRPAGHGPQRVLARSRIIGTEADERVCVLFLQDLRELEARVRTERLVSMGRMSTAVAHEIRNPLAAIVQANALLDEDLSEPRLRRLTQMIRQNASRLEGIVDEILDISRVRRSSDPAAQPRVPLNGMVAPICLEWEQNAGAGGLLLTDLCADDPPVTFAAEHLRRVLINLLDNARRYASGAPGSIQVFTRRSAPDTVVLGVWSDGAPMDASVERHLFEPFFSSESRSTGLGLYICRELCEGQGATIGFERSRRARAGALVEGNAFLVTMDLSGRAAAGAHSSDRMPLTP